MILRADPFRNKAGETSTTVDQEVAPALEHETRTNVHETKEQTRPSNKAGETNTTVDQEVAPAVEHETRTNVHETKEQTVVDKERHQDHYHTTIQPLKDREVLPEKHGHTQAATQYREIDRDTGDAKTQAERERSGFEDTSEEGKTIEKQSKEPTVTGEQVHHHLHETIQPVIEKGRLIDILQAGCMEEFRLTRLSQKRFNLPSPTRLFLSRRRSRIRLRTTASLLHLRSRRTSSKAVLMANPHRSRRLKMARRRSGEPIEVLLVGTRVLYW